MNDISGNESIKELEMAVGSLQKEKDGLQQALEDAKQNLNATKVSEQRRKRLQELELQITDLRKKMVEQSKMLKMKDQTDKQVTNLNQEIQSLKQHRVRLMKQMKEESDAFRKLKQEKDKEVMQLQQKDRKRQVEISKLQRENQKTQNILKLKSEEAAAANRRLKEALAKQKCVQEERSKKFEKADNTNIGNRVRKAVGPKVQEKLIKDVMMLLHSVAHAINTSTPVVEAKTTAGSIFSIVKQSIS
ncbi:hypothetical protein CHS0354_022579 [Potamilus streckersoni]|uniref:Uncharacterized protein n=1 Tax=Potamilus streckersoni TaxID=2493646 RepID=A0AAE0VW96_9BIVA|nr:hypothetical protein CHS0354_022579 [Potamilus streckersoni]